MSGETDERRSSWTPDTLKVLLDERSKHDGEMRELDSRFAEERDRRYTEVNIEREKALKIKETADLAALSLAREIQDYKDEKANNLREQITGERGQYATKDDIKAAINEFRANRQVTQNQLVAAILALVAILAFLRSIHVI